METQTEQNKFKEVKISFEFIKNKCETIGDIINLENGVLK